MLEQIELSKEVVIQPAPYQSVRVGVKVTHVRAENETPEAMLAKASEELKATLIRNLEGTIDELDYLDGEQWRARLGMLRLNDDKGEADEGAFGTFGEDGANGDGGDDFDADDDLDDSDDEDDFDDGPGFVDDDDEEDDDDLFDDEDDD